LLGASVLFAGPRSVSAGGGGECDPGTIKSGGAYSDENTCKGPTGEKDCKQACKDSNLVLDWHWCFQDPISEKYVSMCCCKKGES